MFLDDPFADSAADVLFDRLCFFEHDEYGWAQFIRILASVDHFICNTRQWFAKCGCLYLLLVAVVRNRRENRHHAGLVGKAIKLLVVFTGLPDVDGKPSLQPRRKGVTNVTDVIGASLLDLNGNSPSRCAKCPHGAPLLRAAYALTSALYNVCTFAI